MRAQKSKRKPKRKVSSEETLTAVEEKIVARGFKELKRGQSTPWPQVKKDLSKS